MKKILTTLIAVMMALTPVAAFADENDIVADESKVEALATGNDVYVEKTQVTVAIGQTVTVGATGAVSAGDSDDSVIFAHLGDSGVVITGVNIGTAYVYVYGETSSCTITVTVTEPAKDPYISKTSMTLGYNCEGSIQYWGFPCKDNHSYSVTSSNSNVVDVYEIDAWYDGKYGYDENGRDVHIAYFWACGYGKATITVSDGTYKKTCIVTVPDKRVRLNKTSVKLKKGKKITLKVLNAKGKVKWKSSKKKVATVSKKGVVKGKKKGTAIITAKVNGRTYKCKVKVVKK